MKVSVQKLVIGAKCPKPKCAGLMTKSKAIAQTWVGSPEWAGDTIYTMSPGGSGKLVDCLKCDQCGYSVSL